MSVLSWASIAFYCAFSTLIFYQQLHAKNFRGASQGFGFALAISGFLGMLTGFAYLIYYGWSVAWWAPIVIFIISLVTFSVGLLVERIVGAFALSIAAFAGWPLCAYFMFKFIPSNT